VVLLLGLCAAVCVCTRRRRARLAKTGSFSLRVWQVRPSPRVDGKSARAPALVRGRSRRGKIDPVLPPSPGGRAQARADGWMNAGSADVSGSQPCTDPQPSRSSKRGPLLDEPSLGQDTVYDGAHNMKSTSVLYGPKGGMWSSPQNYSFAFRSATPRPWQRPASTKFPILGPGQHEAPVGPKGDTHLFSASTSWQSRGRSGPVGHPFDASRKSSSFQSNVGRFGLQSRERRRGPTSSSDVFIVPSDHRKAEAVRNDFCSGLQMRTLHWDTFSNGRATTAAPGLYR